MQIVLWALGVIVVLLALFAAAAIFIGGRLPQDHVASRTVAFRRRPEDVWAAINDPAIMEARGQGMGKTELVESAAPRRLVRRVVGEKDYGGTWTCEIARAPDGCALTITEEGYVYNPFFRFVSKYVIGHHRSIDGVIANLKRRFSEA
jgi:hypothetical protein